MRVPTSITRLTCVHAGMNIDQWLLILVVKTPSPAGFPSSDLIRDYFTRGMSGETEEQERESAV